MSDKRSWPPMGAASLFTAFAVLLLTVLALLSLSQARQDRRLAETAAENTAACYEAERQAHIILAQLRSGEAVPGVTRDQGILAYRCPVSAYQSLEVELDGETWEILRWQFTAHPDAPNETLAVWTGTGAAD